MIVNKMKGQKPECVHKIPFFKVLWPYLKNNLFYAVLFFNLYISYLLDYSTNVSLLHGKKHTFFQNLIPHILLCFHLLMQSLLVLFGNSGDSYILVFFLVKYEVYNYWLKRRDIIFVIRQFYTRYHMK